MNNEERNGLQKQRRLAREKCNQLQSNWNSLREWLEDLSKGKLINGEYTQLVGIRIEYVLDKMNELEGKK